MNATTRYIASRTSQAGYLAAMGQSALKILILLAFVATARAAEVELTTKEAAFLQAHPVWRMAGASSRPFQWLDERGELQGIGRDYRTIIEKRLGIQLQLMPAETWEASLEQLRRKECDVSLLTAQTPSRAEFLLFTAPILNLPLTVITRRNHANVSDIAALAGDRVAVARHRPIHEKLQTQFPNITLVPRDDVASAISAVALGDADAYLGELASATDAIDRLGVTNLKVAGETSFVFPFRIAVRKDWPEAQALLDKVIGSVSAAEHAAIRRKWISPIGGGWPLERILMIAVPTAIGLVLLTLLLANHRLTREIAQRRKTETALRESEERWGFALDGSRDGVWDWNVATNDVFFSNRFHTILGYSEGELPARFDTWESRIHPNDLSVVQDAVQKHLRGETAGYEVEHRLRAKDGSFRWIRSRGRVVARDDAGKPLRIVGTQTDITERKESDLALQSRLEETVRARTLELERAERGLRQITNNIPGAVYQFEKKVDGSFAFTFCSEGLESLLGVDCADAIRDVNSVWAVIHPDDLSKLVMMANDSAETLTHYVQDLRICQPDGRTWWIRAEAAPQRQSDGSTLWNGNIMDITDRKRLEEELEKSKRVADSANRAKSVFLANMSHEIRTPMNAILGFSQLLLRDPALTSTQRNHLETVSRSGEHLLALINDILEISKIEAGRVSLQVSSFDVYALLEDLDRLFRTRAEAKGLQFSISCDSTVPKFLNADCGKLRQVLINLISNAVKFTERGAITVRLAANRESGKHVRLTGKVIDTGAGIDSADLPKLFRQFEQTETGRRAAIGTGLGLAISREFIRLMGGDIAVQSERGQGTTFSFDLPAEEAEPFAQRNHEQRRVLRLRPAHLGMRALIADDKPENRELLELILRPVGFETRAVEDGAQAIAAFAEWHPHIGLFDLRMPGTDGFEAIRKIRSLPNGPNTPIIAVTASAFEENRRDVVAAGGDDFIGKPFREHDLFEKIARLTGAEFEYENTSNEDPGSSPAPPITPAQLTAAIPGELRTEIAAAALRADFDAMLTVIGKLEAHSPHVAQELRRKVESFEYQSLLDLAPAQNLSR